MSRISEAASHPDNQVFFTGNRSLEFLLEPQNIAVFGAGHEAGTVGNELLKNLIDAPFNGQVFPIHAVGETIFEMTSYTSIFAVPDRVDLAVIATPLSIVPNILQDCVETGVKCAVVISPGFRETGAIGRTLERQLRKKLGLAAMRLLGPNSLGVMNPRKGLNATLSSTLARPGNLGFISQSGALCRAVLDWSFHENVGFSAFISMGSMLDISWGDLISYLGDDPHTQSIVIHMEAVGEARSFLAAAREVARIKPIILLKGGCTEAAVKAAIAHTGGVVGNNDVFAAALQRCGVLQVNRISELFNMAEVLAKRRFAPHGNRLTIVTNSGGLGVLATDALITTGGQMANLTPQTLAELDAVLPNDWSRSNPIDILGDADSDRFRQVIQLAIADAQTDGVLVILAPQGVADPTDTAEKLKDLVNQLQTSPYRHKPILASWVGGAEVLAGETILNRYQIPTYPYPDSAARLFNLMWQHSDSLQGLVELPVLPDQWPTGGPHRAVVSNVIQTAQQEQRTTLTTMETEMVLQAYGLPMVETHLANHEGQALRIAEQLGYPVIVKPNQTMPDMDITDRQLAPDASALGDAYHRFTQDLLDSSVVLQPLIETVEACELRLSSEIDPQFGPMIRLSTSRWIQDRDADWSSGCSLNQFRHQAVALPPLTSALAQKLIEQTTIYPALQKTREAPGSALVALAEIIIRFSQLVVEQPRIQSVWLNRLLLRSLASATEDTAPHWLVTDAQIQLQPRDRPAPDLPQPLLRAYPIQYVTNQALKDGAIVTLRPVRPTDEMMLIAFHEHLAVPAGNPEENHYPHLGPLGLYGTVAQITRLCFLDFSQEIALIAEIADPQTTLPTIKGVARLTRLSDPTQGRVTFEVHSDYRDHDLGVVLLNHLIQVAQQEGIWVLQVSIAQHPWLAKLCHQAGFVIHPENQAGIATRLIQPEGEEIF